MSSEPTPPPRRKAGLLGWLAGTDIAGQLDERERTVMVESYAIGFTVHLYLCFALAAIAIWVWGAPVKWVTWWLLVLPVVALAAIVRWNAVHGGVSPYSDRCMTRRDRVLRAAPALVLVVVWLVGMLRASSTSLDASTMAGMVVGAAAGLGVVALVVLGVGWLSKRRLRDEHAKQPGWDDEEFD